MERGTTRFRKKHLWSYLKKYQMTDQNSIRYLQRDGGYNYNSSQIFYNQVFQKKFSVYAFLLQILIKTFELSNTQPLWQSEYFYVNQPILTSSRPQHSPTLLSINVYPSTYGEIQINFSFPLQIWGIIFVQITRCISSLYKHRIKYPEIIGKYLVV